jgi:Nucleotidyl transferase of unknown function (DUF2204)
MNKPAHDGERIQLANEAVRITRELGDVTFVGAVAVYFHTKGARSRATRDLDFAVAIPITPEQLREKEYKIFQEGKKERIRTPRNYKIDIYTGDVGEIPVIDIINRAKSVPVGKSGKNSVKIMCLEDLIITKHRTPRGQDAEDLFEIAKTKFFEIQWSLLQSLTKSEYEFSEIKTKMNALYKMKQLPS